MVLLQRFGCQGACGQCTREKDGVVCEVHRARQCVALATYAIIGQEQLSNFTRRPETQQEKVLTQEQQHRDTHQETRVCKICGHTFLAGQNTRRGTCSPDCEAQQLLHNERSKRSH